MIRVAMTSFTFDLTVEDKAKLLGICESRRLSAPDVVRRMVFDFIEQTGARAAGRSEQKLRGVPLRIMQAVKPIEQFSCPDIGRAISLPPASIRYALNTLMTAGLVESAGVRSSGGGRHADAFRLTAQGELWQYEQVDTSAKKQPTIPEQRAAVKAFLARGGISLADANRALEEAEATAYIGDYTMDYSLDFWKEWLAGQNEPTGEEK